MVTWGSLCPGKRTQRVHEADLREGACRDSPHSLCGSSVTLPWFKTKKLEIEQSHWAFIKCLNHPFANCKSCTQAVTTGASAVDPNTAAQGTWRPRRGGGSRSSAHTGVPSPALFLGSPLPAHPLWHSPASRWLPGKGEPLNYPATLFLPSQPA